MKITLLLLCFQLSVSSTYPFLGAAQEAVLDFEGEELQTGVTYNILSTLRPRGGFTVGSNRNNESSCPLDVVQAPLWLDSGLAWTFSPYNNDTVVRVSTDLNIKSSAPTICVQPLVWKLSDYDASVGRFFVTTDGVEGNPGCRTLTNWFRIEKDVGIFGEDGILRLALSDFPERVLFRKAADDSKIIKNAADQ
ncbi:hypothetical protein F0562_015519 [Nyssa sinensis]|uniref:Uncharacterized protein n=1 Tax=Nyssa sinensis TaxID=561372 RepID=A0A5J4ZLV6_9ASTE|nr:hypothetical protein F0562_015519 [Nyssa sinensis]